MGCWGERAVGGEGKRGFISKETVIIFHVTGNKWGLSGWLMTGSLLRWNQEKVSVYWCQSFSDGSQCWWIVGSGSDYTLHWHPLIPDPFVILETGNKHTYSRQACIRTQTHTHTHACRNTHSLLLRSLHQFWHFLQTSAQSEAAWRKSPEHTACLVPRKVHANLSVTRFSSC